MAEFRYFPIDVWRDSDIILVDEENNHYSNTERTAMSHKLQYQLSNGEWVDTPQKRITEFLDRCVEFNADILDHDQAIEAMTRGRKLRNYASDWYSNCRMTEPQDDDAPALPTKEGSKRCPKCGKHGRFTTVGHICDDCV